jgi:hypothetical protein
MPVVINEFEVIAEPPTRQSGAEKPATASTPTSPGPTPHEIERVICRQKERFARIRAH